MKTLIEILGTVFLTVGAVVGAGFISGRELLSFFGDNFAVYLPITALAFFGAFYLIFVVGSKYGSITELNKKLFKTPTAFNGAVKISCFISSAVMLSAIDALTAPINPTGLPVYSVLTLIILSFVSKKGIKGARIINFIIMPLVIISVNLIIGLCGKLTLPTITPITAKGGIKTLLYVTMNIFMNLPSFVDGARGKSNKKLCVISALSAILLTGQAAFILCTIKGYGNDLSSYPLPLLAALGNGFATPIFSAVCIIAVFTSLTTAYYPLYGTAKEKNSKFGGVILAVACFLASRLGIKNIIDYAYPLIGALGVIYIVKCIILGLKDKKSN